MKNYIEKFTIPYFQLQVNDWERKKEDLLVLYHSRKQYMIGGEQITDYNSHNNYHLRVQDILEEDLLKAREGLNLKHFPGRVQSCWFQEYGRSHYHGIHNHGIGGFSSVLFIEFDPEHHEPTTFVAPFNEWMRNDMIEWKPDNVTEGTMIFFPMNLSHFAPTNFSDVPRLILSCNIA